jgi:hypothetical protein
MPVWREKEDQQNGSNSRKRSSAKAGLEKGTMLELANTASSPLKPGVEESKENKERSKAQKQLLLTKSPAEPGVGLAVPPPPPTYVPPKELKRQKKGTTDNGKARDAEDKVAGSSGERRQEQ